MGLRKIFNKFRRWCPQPSSPVSSKLKRYSIPITVAMATLLFVVSFSVFSGNLFRSSMNSPPAPMVLTSTSTSSVTQLWSFEPAYSVVNSPVMANGLLYVSSENIGGPPDTLYCINPSTGTQVWNNTSLFPEFTLANGDVYIGCSISTSSSIPGQIGVVSCLNAYNGAIVWNSSYIGGPLFSQSGGYNYGATGFGQPVVNDGAVYAGGHYNNVKTNASYGFIYAFNATTGAQIWSYTGSLGTRFDSVVLSGTNLFAVSPVSSVNSSYSGIFAFDAFTGKELWNCTASGTFSNSVAVDNDNVYVSLEIANSTGQVYQSGVLALNASNGTKIWNSSYPISSTIETPIIANDTVYAVAGNGNIYALDASSGKVIWHGSTGLDTGSVSLVDGNLYVGTSEGVCCFDAANGATVWRFKASDFAGSSGTYPTYAEGIVYVGWDGSMFSPGAEHNFYALNAYNGKILWNYTLAYSLSVSPLVANGVIYIPGSSVNNSLSLFPSGQVSGAFLALKPTVTSLPSPTSSPADPVFSNTRLLLIAALIAVIVVATIVGLVLQKKVKPRR